jgi:hypothetical protein
MLQRPNTSDFVELYIEEQFWIAWSRVAKGTVQQRMDTAELGCAILLQSIRIDGGAGESRTPDTQFRKLLLYPSELQPHEDLYPA